MQQSLIVLDFGGQYKELIARTAREIGILSLVKPARTSVAEIRDLNPVGIIFTGGPHSVYEEGAPDCDSEIFSLGVPIMGICYGMQYIAHRFGGKVAAGKVGEYGETEVNIQSHSKLFEGLSDKETMLMSHTDAVIKVPEGFVVTATTSDCPAAAMENKEKNIYAVQFHPEVKRSKQGVKVLENFIKLICRAKCDYSLDDYIQNQIKIIRDEVGDGKVLLGLSGGVDSSVAAALISRAIPDRLLCVYVDHGFMRKNETEEIKSAFKDLSLKLLVIDAKDKFMKRLKGVTDPEKKRKAVGKEFINTFARAAKKYGKGAYLAQGTIYPDVIESGANNSANIKSHHNVGGLPKNMPFKGLVEPLKGLFKDEVRKIGAMLGLPSNLISRQPFPGPGLAIRVIGEVTEEKLTALKESDFIFRKTLAASGEKADQYFAVLTDSKSVGVIGDYRNYGYVLCLRAVITDDFMTAEYAPLSYKLLDKTAAEIVNNVRCISRVCYDVTGKPPATIEWE